MFDGFPQLTMANACEFKTAKLQELSMIQPKIRFGITNIKASYSHIQGMVFRFLNDQRYANFEVLTRVHDVTKLPW